MAAQKRPAENEMEVVLHEIRENHSAGDHGSDS